MKSVADIVSRIGELKAMHSDVTKNPTDKANYDSEFTDLVAQIKSITSTADNQGINFNDINVFKMGGTSSVIIDEFGTNSFAIDTTNIKTDTELAAVLAGNLTALGQSDITDALEEVAKSCHQWRTSSSSQLSVSKPRYSDHKPIRRQWSYHGCGYRTGVCKLGKAASAGTSICRHDSSGKYIQRCRPHAPAIMQHRNLSTTRKSNEPIKIKED